MERTRGIQRHLKQSTSLLRKWTRPTSQKQFQPTIEQSHKKILINVDSISLRILTSRFHKKINRTELATDDEKLSLRKNIKCTP